MTEIRSLCIEEECVPGGLFSEEMQAHLKTLDSNKDGTVSVRFKGVHVSDTDISSINLKDHFDQLRSLLQYRDLADPKSGISFQVYSMPHKKRLPSFSIDIGVSNLAYALDTLRFLDLLPKNNSPHKVAMIYRDRDGMRAQHGADGLATQETFRRLNRIVLDDTLFEDETLVAHELTHVILQIFDDDQSPQWFHEGLAEYVAHFNPARPPASRLRLPRDLSLSLNDQWKHPTQEGHQDDDTYHAFFLFLESQYGRGVFSKTLSHLEAMRSLNGSLPEQAATKSLLKATGVQTLIELERGYIRWVSQVVSEKKQPRTWSQAEWISIMSQQPLRGKDQGPEMIAGALGFSPKELSPIKTMRYSALQVKPGWF